jgi:5-methyltetrahydropteroyltriglutamate--homocysteine methyltransferase
MKTNNLGYPRIGANRELKKACEQYWSEKISAKELLAIGQGIRQRNWGLQKTAGIDLIPSNDFSFYDQVLDMSLTVGAIPERYKEVATNSDGSQLNLYFAMARGYQKKGLDIIAMEMTKWFDTNYHYIVPEFYKDQTFQLSSTKIIDEFIEAQKAGIKTKPVIIGPVTYLMLGKEKVAGFDRIDLIGNLLPVYFDILKKLEVQGVEWVQFDEPFLALDLTEKVQKTYQQVYAAIKQEFPKLKTLIAVYFEGLKDNLQLAVNLPVTALHIDLVRCPEQLDDVLKALPNEKILSMGIVDGRNIWKNDFQQSLSQINKATKEIGSERILIAPSCSLLHSPSDLDFETTLKDEIIQWLAFAKQKIYEVITLKQLATGDTNELTVRNLKANQVVVENRKTSKLIHNDRIKQNVSGITDAFANRQHVFAIRRKIQESNLHLPLFPTTTIGSFPQTIEVRSWRAKFKKGEISAQQYETLLKGEIEKAIRWQ